MKLYLAAALGDFVLVALAAISLSFTVLDGFYVDPSLQYSPLPVLAAIVCLLALFAASSSKRFLLPGGIAYAVALFIVWGVCAALTPGGAIFIDNETNYLIFSMVVTLVPTGCFLLTRTRVGTALLFVIGAFLIGLIQLFYERFELLWTILFVIAALALIVYKHYERSLRIARGVEKVSFLPGFATAAAATAAAVGLGVLVWFAIIAPLNPSAIDIKLITEYRALETVQVRGISDVYQTPNLEMTSDETNEDMRTTDDIKEDLSGTPWPATGESEEEPEETESDNAMLGIDLDSFLDAFDFQSNPQNWPLLIIVIVVIAAIVLYFVLRRVWREKRLAQFKELGPDKEFEQVFLFLMERFRRIGVTVPPGQTLREFGVSSTAAMRLYNEESGVSFQKLANAYADLAYGKRSVGEAGVLSIESYYRGFWKACRKQLGNLSYFFKSFRL